MGKSDARLSIRIPGDLLNLLEELAELQGASVSSLVRDHLLVLAPIFRRNARLLRLVNESKAAVPRVVETLDGLISDIEKTLEGDPDFVELYELLSEGADPPASNRGVTGCVVQGGEK